MARQLTNDEGGEFTALATQAVNDPTQLDLTQRRRLAELAHIHRSANPDDDQARQWVIVAEGYVHELSPPPPLAEPSLSPPPPRPLASPSPPPPRTPPQPGPAISPGPAPLSIAASPAWWTRPRTWVLGGAAMVLVAALSQVGGNGPDVTTTGSPDTMSSTTDATASPSSSAARTGNEFPATNADYASAAAAQLNGLPVDSELAAGADYDRGHYQPSGWPDTDGDCQNNRHEVLAAESLIPVTYGPDGCFVEAGQWFDPYTGETYVSADQVTIDHFVPLAHAHRAGAWAWDLPTKQAFTNDLDDPAALAVVGAGINQAKSDNAPDRWRPPRREVWCLYATDWIRVKTRWQLPVTQAETDALTEMLATCTEPESDPIPTDRLTTPSMAPIVTTTTTTTTTASTTSTTRPPTTPAPTPSTTQAPAPSCDPNYEGACVPIASDVDCAGGSGNGPAYVRGPVYVVGSDIYGLDGDNDGIGCE